VTEDEFWEDLNRRLGELAADYVYQSEIAIACATAATRLHWGHRSVYQALRVFWLDRPPFHIAQRIDAQRKGHLQVVEAVYKDRYAISAAAQMKAAGKSYQTIADRLNARKRLRRRDGRRWTKSNVKRAFDRILVLSTAVEIYYSVDKPAIANYQLLDRAVTDRFLGQLLLDAALGNAPHLFAYGLCAVEKRLKHGDNDKTGSDQECPRSPVGRRTSPSTNRRRRRGRSYDGLRS
jgi:hypothetical protein